MFDFDQPQIAQLLQCCMLCLRCLNGTYYDQEALALQHLVQDMSRAALCIIMA